MHSKIKSIDELQTIANEMKANQELLVFTNGCFDLLHIGHVRYLQKAAQLGDKLVVAVNSDSSVQELKGKGRPLVKEKDRLELLSALEMIDYLVLFSDIDCQKLLEVIEPPIYVKGGDYRIEDLPEAEVVYDYGGKIVLITKIKGRSTSDLIKKIRGK